MNKVFYVQIVDAERLDNPLLDGHEYHVASQPPRMSWSRNCRLFAFETERGGYLPVVDIAKIIFQRLGYDGWMSLELFSRLELIFKRANNWEEGLLNLGFTEDSSADDFYNFCDPGS